MAKTEVKPIDALEKEIRQLEFRIEHLGSASPEDHQRLEKLRKKVEIERRKAKKTFEREASRRGMSVEGLLVAKTNPRLKRQMAQDDYDKKRERIRKPRPQPQEKMELRLEEEIEVGAEVELGYETKTLSYMAIARAVALASMPRRKLDIPRISKIIRLGPSDWMVVSWVALRFEEGVPLPYHQDRLIYSGIVMETIRHAKKAQDDGRMIRFGELQEVMALAEQAGIRTRGGKLAQRLRDGLERLGSVMLLVDFYKSRPDAEARKNAKLMTNIPLVRAFSLPGRKDLAASARGERSLGLDMHFIELGQDHWDYVRDPKNILWVPAVYMAALSDEPLALAALLYLAARCQAAQTDVQEVPHEELVEIFNDHGSEERFLFRDLTEAIDRVTRLTNGALRAELIDVTKKKTTGQAATGRPKKRWALRVYRAQAPFLRRQQVPALGGAASDEGPLSLGARNALS
jgi:hypothetical protein